MGCAQTGREAWGLRRVLGLLLLVVLLASCSGSAPEGVYSKAHAREVAWKILNVWKQGQLAELLDLCTVPFRFGARTWSTRKELRRNLATQVPRWQQAVLRFQKLVLYSHHDLEEGRWPRGLKVPASKREERLVKLGVGVDGFLIRATSGRDPGWQLILQDSGNKLLLGGILP